PGRRAAGFQFGQDVLHRLLRVFRDVSGMLRGGKAGCGKFANTLQRTRCKSQSCKLPRATPVPPPLRRCYGIRVTQAPSRSMQLPVPVVTIGLLVASNVFMTFAWYGHLKFKT